MTYPPDDYRASGNGSGNGMRLEHDRSIINGSMLALVAFIVVAIGIIWYAVTDGRARIAAGKHPGIERSVPDGTTGYGGMQPKAPVRNPGTK